MNVLSLFTGIGGLDLGLERAGMSVVGQVEVDPFCRSVLARHWPEVPKHDDVRTTPTWWQAQPRPGVDMVAGGFPCQPFSTAGRRRGLTDERWGWPWMRDVVAAVRPRYVLAENVAALLRDTDAFRLILGDLSDLGFDAEWSVVPACAVGAPHTRRRLFVVAYPHRGDGTPRLGTRPRRTLRPSDGGTHPWADPHHGFLAARPRTDRVADGLPAGLDAARITALGNAVVPTVAEALGHLIQAHHHATQTKEAA